MRKIISTIIAIGLIGGAIYLGMSISKKNKPKKQEVKNIVQTVYTVPVENGDIPIKIEESGRLVAKDRVEVYAEVQGVMERTSKDFKPGTSYKKSELMVKIRDDDFYANLQAQKSVLQNLITSILPDLRLDYPEAYDKWDKYVKNFNMNKPVKSLPKTSSEKEKFFITSKNIYTTFYNTKNLEIVLGKYSLKAPFNGVLTEALVTPGTVVRPGQKLGELIDPSVYELELSISKSYLPELSIGKKVSVSDPGYMEDSWAGTISRINGKVDATTQTIKAYIDVAGETLREGMYLQASIEANSKSNALEISRNLLLNGDKVYIVEDNLLRVIEVKVLHKTTDSLVIRGLENGMQLVSKPVPGGYNGMEVSVVDNN